MERERERYADGVRLPITTLIWGGLGREKYFQSKGGFLSEIKVLSIFIGHVKSISLLVLVLLLPPMIKKNVGLEIVAGNELVSFSRK